MAESTQMSKTQLKKMAKKKAVELKKLAKKAEKGLPEITDKSTPEKDFESRINLTSQWRNQFAPLYRPPFPITHRKYNSLYQQYFSKMDDTMIGKMDESELVCIIGRVSSARGAGKLGFLTLYYPPEQMYDDNGKDYFWVLRPELQVLLRPQTFQVATVEQTPTDSFKTPIFNIKESNTTETERFKENVKFIKNFIGRRARVFDQYYVVGYPGLSNTGEKTIYCKYIFPASVNHHMVNALHGAEEHGVETCANQEVAYRNPYLRWLYDSQNVYTQILRSQYTKNLRHYLDNELKLMSVDIPHLVSTSSGANAKPFETYQHDNDMHLQLRIAPELELKMCIIGDIDSNGCYHIGSQFRNEGQDMTHNPEFNSCEFYMRHVNFEQLMEISETLIKNTIIITLYQNQTISHKQYLEKDYNIISQDSSVFHIGDKGYRVIWNSKFVDINFMEGINNNLKEGYKLPDPSTFEMEDSIQKVKEIAMIHNVNFKETDSIAKVLDNMFDELVLPLTYQPNFANSYFKEFDDAGNLIISPVTVYGHPKVMSPLAMELFNGEHPTGLVYRFESFVAGMEICNAYQELSDPMIQRHNFESQKKFQEKGDDEAMTQNDSFVKGLEYGMCPTAGWGMGLERIFMLITDKCSIRDVLPFPLMKPITTET